MADNVAITAGSGTTIGTDERSVNSTNVQIQRVVDQGASTYANGQVSVATSAGTLLAARDTRKSVTFLNMGANTVYIGAATVTAANGFKLDPGASVTLEIQALIQGIAVGAAATVCYVESYDS